MSGKFRLDRFLHMAVPCWKQSNYVDMRWANMLLCFAWQYLHESVQFESIF